MGPVLDPFTPLALTAGILTNLASDVLKYHAGRLDSVFAGRSLKAAGLVEPNFDDRLRGMSSEALGLEVGEWIDRWRAEISPGETLLDLRYGRCGSYHTQWNLRLNVAEEQLIEWRRY